jgi:hypothetical protein
VASSGQWTDPWRGSEGLAVRRYEMAQVREPAALCHFDLTRNGVSRSQQRQTCPLEMPKL